MKLIEVARLWDTVEAAPEEQRGSMDQIQTAKQLLSAVRVRQQVVESANKAHKRAGEFNYSRYSTVEKFA